MEEAKHVTIYTDGACSGNPGPGGYGAILLYQGEKRELSGGYGKTTNNRMEIMAAIAGLEALREMCRVTLYSDSEYLVKAMSKGWAQRWRANGWKRNKREKALNSDLWERLLQLCQRHEVQFRWIKGHAETTENIRCDELAMQAAQQPNLPVDEGYISQSEAAKTRGYARLQICSGNIEDEDESGGRGLRKNGLSKIPKDAKINVSKLEHLP
jgi:ribonuclease HI